jgi:hypothetical protein
MQYFLLIFSRSKGGACLVLDRARGEGYKGLLGVFEFSSLDAKGFFWVSPVLKQEMGVSLGESGFC